MDDVFVPGDEFTIRKVKNGWIVSIKELRYFETASGMNYLEDQPRLRQYVFHERKDLMGTVYFLMDIIEKK